MRTKAQQREAFNSALVSERYKLNRGTHATSQEKIDELVDGTLSGISFSARPVYNAKIGSPGKTQILMDESGRVYAKVEIGKQYKPDDAELIDTIVHEELEARIGLNRHTSEKYFELQAASDDDRHEYIQMIINRYVKMKGL